MKWLKDWWSRQCFHDWEVIDEDVTSAFGCFEVVQDAVCMKCGKRHDELSRARAI